MTRFPRALVCLVMAGAVVQLGGCGGSNNDVLLETPTTTASEPTVVVAGEAASPAVYAVPEGWVVADDGLIVAASPVDLSAVVPTGPRVVVVTELVETDAAAEDVNSVDIEILEEPTSVTVDGQAGAAIVLEEIGSGGAVVREYVVVGADDDAVLYRLEAPPHDWLTVRPILEDVIALERD